MKYKQKNKNILLLFIGIIFILSGILLRVIFSKTFLPFVISFLALGVLIFWIVLLKDFPIFRVFISD